MIYLFYFILTYIDEKTKEKTLNTKFLLNEDPKATANTSYQYYKDTVLQELKELLEAEEKSKGDLLKVLEELGYGIN